MYKTVFFLYRDLFFYINEALLGQPFLVADDVCNK